MWTAILVAALATTSEHPLQPKIDRIIENQARVTDFTPTSLTRGDYLQVVDGQIRAMRKYQKPNGDLPDPVDGRTQFSPACYAHCVATLAASKVNSDPDILESGIRAMDFSVSALLQGRAAFPDGHSDFYIYPVMLAFEHFEKVVPKTRLDTWREQLAAIDPSKAYFTFGKSHNNWTLVHVGGEFLRAIHGMTDLRYVDHAMKIQRPHLTPLGMYLEHGAPFAYDAFSRYFVTGMLQRGYEDEFYRDACAKGAWTSLMIQSPTGELPTGHRSAQHIWNEAELATIYELYAAEHARGGRVAEASAFKRGAHLALASIKQWIREDGSGYIVKNRYPIEARHGYESYSVHVNYNLLACSMLCAAWQSADETIEEQPAPCDIGGFVVHIPDFHMVVANAGGSYVQSMTQGNGKYNPAGLLRVVLPNGHPQLGYSDGLLGETTKAADKVEVLEEQLEQVRFRAGDTLTVNASGVTIATQPATGVSFPMLLTDGQETTQIEIDGNALRLQLAGRGVEVVINQPAGAVWRRTGEQFRHHNGLVEKAKAQLSSGTPVPWEVQIQGLKPK